MYVCPPPRALWEGSSLIHLCNPNPALGPINSRHSVNVYWINDFNVVSSFAMFSNLHRKQINHYSLSLYFSGQWGAFFDIASLHCYMENVKSAFWIREMVFACEDPDLSSSKLFWIRKSPQHERGPTEDRLTADHTTVDQGKVEKCLWSRRSLHGAETKVLVSALLKYLLWKPFASYLQLLPCYSQK